MNIEQVRALVAPIPPETGREADVAPRYLNGDHALNPAMLETMDSGKMKSAAVLVPIVDREQPTLLFTLRSSTLKHHSGQISFPGGRQEPGETIVETALRESFEEIGLARGLVDVLGVLDCYVTGTNYIIRPVVARVDPRFEPHANPDEVVEIFEAPLDMFFDAGHYIKCVRERGGRPREFYAIAWGEHFIWGATAGILRALCARSAIANGKHRITG
ncbi:MAG: CoA pyrophosphatase [Methylobacteriaceae bacterium]|jgi:8-oxo-dGTP pyrophosphatase MutT (NUDIX family)|nr:CoA pyrophosphatase [Methylobacteriaceae bacterium]